MENGIKTCSLLGYYNTRHFEKFIFTFLTGLIIFGRFLTGPKQIENRRKKGIKKPRNYHENFWI